MAFLLRAMGFGGSSIPNFPFQIVTGADAAQTVQTATLSWTMRPGTRQEDNSPVSIFELPLAGAGPEVIEMARNVVKRSKTLMLPGVLRCYAATEHHNTVYIATEECIPLSRVLSDTGAKEDYYEDSGEKFHEGVALGLRHVGTALVALHSNGLVHGNVCHESVYVLKSGEWRLFGLEMVAGFNEEEGLYRRYWAMLPEFRRPPETLGSSGSVNSPAIHNVDAWGLGALIYSVFSGVALDRLSSVKGSELRSCRSMPRSLQSGYTGLTGTNPKLRLSIEKFLSDTEFIVGSEYVQSLQWLDELALKDATDRDAVYRKLTERMDHFPLRACKFIILAKLSVAVQFGGGSAVALEPILKIGARLTDPAVFAELVAPIVMTLFAATDVMVRVRLLTSASQYARLLPPSLVNEKIWAHFCTGFTSTNANMRELTIRALVHFAPLLSEKNFTADVIRFITQAQQDREGPIRTNATICLCMIAEHIPESVRAKALVHGFGRMLRDPFLPSRVAALKSLHSTMHYYPANLVAEVIVPGVAPLAVDPMPEIRATVFRILSVGIDALRQHSDSMPPPPTAAAAEESGAGSSSPSPPPQASGPDSGNSSSGNLAKSSSGLFGSWGISSPTTTPVCGGSVGTPNVGVGGAPIGSSALAQQQRGVASSSGTSHRDPVTPSNTATSRSPPPPLPPAQAPVLAPASAAPESSWEDALDMSLASSRETERNTAAGLPASSGMKLGAKKKGFGGAAAKVE